MEPGELSDQGTSGQTRAGRLGALARRAAPLLAAGIVGGGVAVGVGAAVGLDGGTTTVVREVAAAETSSREPASSPAVGEPDGELSVQEIYERSAPGVVQITAVSEVEAFDPFDPFGPQSRQQRALGSGFVIDKSGHIVTNYHVVEGAEEVDVSFSGGESVRAQVVGVDPSTDLAVLKVDTESRALTPLPLGDSDTVAVGDPVVAIGNPFGLERTVTAGIVSAIQRQITAPDGFTIDNVIQTDAQINRGNSGGPLLDARGEVIGVNSQIETGGAGGNVGIGFAVPINTVREVATQLIETGRVEHAFLGVEVQTITPEIADTFRLPVDEGVLVAAVRPDSPADQAGLRGGDTTATVNGQTWILGGDVITSVDGRAVTDAEELRRIVLAKRPGDTIALEVARDTETLTISVELGRRPATPTG